MLVGGVLLERRSLGGRLEVLEADLALDAFGGEVLCVLSVFTAGYESDRLCFFFNPRRRGKVAKKKEETYGFQLRFGDGAGVLLAVTLGSSFCAVAHGC